ncbi:MAG: hypothetical protein M1405_00080 [Patescibacteria group bacterium]|nr:hypothetical protein [Patescibacteria group bacterium]
MTERGPRAIDLTNQANPHRLNVRGDIFMPGEPGGGETPPIHHPAAETSKKPSEPAESKPTSRYLPVTFERQQEVREAWMRRREEQERGGERITREQLETEEKLIRMGIPPISGGSGDEPEDSQGQPTETDAQAPERRTFKPSAEWQEIPRSVAIPPGATIRMDMESGKSYAKWDTPPETEIEYEFGAESAGDGGGQEPPVRGAGPPASPPGGDGGGNEPPAPPVTPPGGEGGNGNGDENPREEQEPANEGADAAHEPESPTSAADPISKALSRIPEDLTKDEKDFISENYGEDAEDLIKRATEQRRALKLYADQFREERFDRLFDPERSYYKLSEAIRMGEVSAVEAEELRMAIATSAVAERLRRQPPEERDEIRDLLERTKDGTPEAKLERRNGLKGWIERINPDYITVDPNFMRAVAEDPEAAEMFLDKIISKPFASPEDQYSLSFYAAINLSGFLTEVNAVSRQRHTDYVRKKEASLRFHEMNRTIISESGNLEAFLSISRSVTPQHIQTATEITGAAHMRHLIESAFKRLYAAKNQVEEHDFPEQIIERSIRQFYRDAGYELVVEPGENEGKWVYKGRDVIKSEFRDADNNKRPLEVWEIERAVAFGRNMSAAFYRLSELVSWSHVSPEAPEWLKSMPSETVVRNLGGLKMLQERFKYGQTKGGPQFVALLYDKLQKGFKDKSKDYNEKHEKDGERMITKIGKLSILTDILPTGFYKASGFDKGWRTIAAYLDTKVASITIPDSNIFPNLTKKDFPELDPKNFPDYKPEDVPGMVRKAIEELMGKIKGNETTLYRFLLSQELAAQLATAVSDKEATAAGVLTPKEDRPFNAKIQKILVEQALMPLLGYKYNPEGAKKRAKEKNPQEANWIGPWEYKGDAEAGDRMVDQINLSLGILIGNGSSSERVKTALWKKTASFLPLEVGQLLSEAGVRELIDDYDVHKAPNEKIQGEGEFLFSDEFERKLFRAEQSRIRAQVQEQERAVGAEAKAERIAGRIELDSFLATAGLDADEIAFVRKLQKFGKDRAEQLAMVSFPHIPFLEDVPFDKADYISLGAEVFPRRIGRDFSGYAKATEEGGNIIGHLELPYENFLEIVGKVEDSLSGPEGSIAAQDLGSTFLKTYIDLAKQWGITRLPLVKGVREFRGLPTSGFQKIFGREAPSWGPTEINHEVNVALGKGLIRREIIPGEKESQTDEILHHARAAWLNVLNEQGPKGLMFLIMTALFKFFKEVTKSK